jgi:hypothetical protein
LLPGCPGCALAAEGNFRKQIADVKQGYKRIHVFKLQAHATPAAKLENLLNSVLAELLPKLGATSITIAVNQEKLHGLLIQWVYRGCSPLIALNNSPLQACLARTG